MITIYKTNSMKDASRYVLDVVKKIDKSNLSVMHTIIVPDRASLEAERDLLKAVGGSFNAQVRTFRRLANDILPKFSYLSKQAGIMALSGIIRDNADKLKCYSKGTSRGFAENVYDTISMMKYCKISPEDLLKEDLCDGVKGKAKDIALLYRAYLDFTRDRFVDSADKLDLLREYLPKSQSVANGYFYLYDFDNFSKQELDIVEKLLLHSRGVTVACCAGKNFADRYLYLDDIYHGVLSVCKRNGVEPNVVEGESYSHRYSEQIGKNLFRYASPTPICGDGFAELFEGVDRAQEAYQLACKIQRYVRNGGRFRDIFVATSDINKYFNAVSLTFSEFNIPYFCDKTTALSTHPYARFVIDYLNLIRYNGKIDKVLPFVKNCLFSGYDDSPKREDVYFFENYCLKYNVSFNYDKFTLGKGAPHEEKMFRCADSFRDKFNKLFKTYKLPDKASVKEYVDLCRKFIEATNLDKLNEDFEKAQIERGLEYEAKVTAQVAEKFDGVLSQAENVVGEREVTLEEFIQTLCDGVSSVSVSVIPVHNDCVIIANMAKARKHDIKFLALLGANYGAMPIVKSDCKLLNDGNISELEKSGVNLEPMIFTENKRERFSLFQLLLEPTEKLYVSYSQTDGGTSLIPSPFVSELQNVFTDKYGRKILPCAVADEGLFSERQAVFKTVADKRKIKDNQPVESPFHDILCTLYGSEADKFEYVKESCDVSVERGLELFLKNSATSVSQLTDFYKCPYRFFVQYGLNVKPRVIAKLQSADLGNVLHNVLELYVRDADVSESDETTKEKASRCFEEALFDDFYEGMRRDPKMAGTLKQLKDESLKMCVVVKKQLSDSEFVNLHTEMAFGGSSPNPPVVVEFDGGKFNLVGKIDRVDVKDGKFIVIDYKSGAHAAHYAEKDLYVGHKMQLLVYVKAVEQMYKYKPAGFYYFAMHNDFDDVSKEKIYVYTGRTLDDKTVACQIDKKLAETGSSEKLGLRLKKDGELYRSSKLLNAEQIDNQTGYAFRLIEAAGKHMKNGYVPINPYEGTCDYCDYKDICDFNDVFAKEPRKVSEKVTSKTIDEVQNG